MNFLAVFQTLKSKRGGGGTSGRQAKHGKATNFEQPIVFEYILIILSNLIVSKERSHNAHVEMISIIIDIVDIFTVIDRFTTQASHKYFPMINKNQSKDGIHNSVLSWCISDPNML